LSLADVADSPYSNVTDADDAATTTDDEDDDLSSAAAEHR